VQWYGCTGAERTETSEAGETTAVPAPARKKAWARLLAKVYEIDILNCPECGGRMSVMAVIRDPQSIAEGVIWGK